MRTLLLKAYAALILWLLAALLCNLGVGTAHATDYRDYIYGAVTSGHAICGQATGSGGVDCGFAPAPIDTPTFTTKILVPAGSAAHPGVAWSDNATTGLWEVAANRIGFSISGTSVAQFLSTGLSMTSGDSLSLAGANLTVTSTSDGTIGSGALEVLNTSAADRMYEYCSGSNCLINVDAAGSDDANTTIELKSNVGTTIDGATVKLPNVTTGTNADTLCLSAGSVILIQAAACTISSLRFKIAVEATDMARDTMEVMLLRPIAFNMKPAPNPDPNYGHRQTGLSAEDVAAVAPDCAVYEPDMKTPKSWRQECVIAKLVSAVQAQQKEIDLMKWMLRP